MASAAPEKSRKSPADRNAPSDVPIQILVYRNGDEYDPGTEVVVTRHQFKHWLAFLEYVTHRIQLHGAVNKIYTMEGQEVRHFRELQNFCRYIAARHNVSLVKYGSRLQKPWNKDDKVKYKDYTGIDSGDSVKIYLESNKFKPTLHDMWDDPEFDQKKKLGKVMPFKARPVPKFPDRPIQLPKGKELRKNQQKFDQKSSQQAPEVRALANFEALQQSEQSVSEPVAPPHNDYVPMMKAKSEWDMGGTPPPRRGYTPTSRPTTVKSEDVFNARTSSALDTEYNGPVKLSRTPTIPNQQDFQGPGIMPSRQSSFAAKRHTGNNDEIRSADGAPLWAKELKMAVMNLEKAVEKIDPKLEKP